MVGHHKGNSGIIASFRNLGDVLQGPKPALFYGAWGVLPFISIPIYLSITGKYVSQLIFADLAYGASILSFLGAVRWGLAIPNSKDKLLKPTYQTMGWAVTPASIAWIAMLVSQTKGTLIIVGGFTACIIQDCFSTEYPVWYKSFRIIFASLAVVSLTANFLLFQSEMA